MTDAVRSKAEDPLPRGAETRSVALIKCAPLPWLPVASDPHRSSCWRERCPQQGKKRHDFPEHLARYCDLGPFGR